MSGDQQIRVNVFAANPEEMVHLDLLGGPAACGWPSIDSTEWAKGLDRLAAAVSGRATDEFGDHELVFPPGAADWDGPWLVRVPDDVVRAIAGLDPEAIAHYADETRGPDEQDSVVVAVGRTNSAPETSSAGEQSAHTVTGPGDSLHRLRALRELCHRACDERRHVYQWSTE